MKEKTCDRRHLLLEKVLELIRMLELTQVQSTQFHKVPLLHQMLHFQCLDLKNLVLIGLTVG